MCKRFAQREELIIGVAAGAGAEDVGTAGRAEQILTALDGNLGPAHDIRTGGIVVKLSAANKDGLPDFFSGCFIQCVGKFLLPGLLEIRRNAHRYTFSTSLSASGFSDSSQDDSQRAQMRSSTMSPS